MSATAARAEAVPSEDKPIVIGWRGQNYRLIPSADWDINVLEAMEDGKITHILRGILAKDGYDRLAASKPKITDLTEFVEKAFKALGVSGN